MKTKENLNALRARMRKLGLTAYLIPSTDPHQSEYLPECWMRRPWFSGFTGSAGDVVVTLQEAGLWTDGRYFLQAENELRGSGIKLFRMGEPKVPKLQDYLAATLRKGEAVGVDPRLISAERAADLEKALTPSGGRLAYPEENLVDELWKDRPAVSTEPVLEHPVRFAGETVSSKLRRLRAEMRSRRVQAHVLNNLDAIAWLFNIRGRDIAYNPLVISYAIVDEKSAGLFVHAGKVPAGLEKKLSRNVTIRPYDEFAGAMRKLAGGKPRVWLDSSVASRWMRDLLEGCEILPDRSPVMMMKARKNDTEIAGMKAAHLRDGAAMVRFLHWLEREVAGGKVTELSAAEALEAFRAEGEHFVGPSFDTISGYAGNGAVIHYRVTGKTNLLLKPQGIYLTDSGGQYLDGTTDITRTVLLGGKATKDQKDQFTRVLKGNIALASARFPSGIAGYRLDTLARQPLWEAGLDYNHGTGHGVGAHLGVHEGPQNIGTRWAEAGLEPGNILSNEPGYYVNGEYGMRIENLILVRELPKHGRDGRSFLGFETITLCPIDRRLIEPKLLSSVELDWINAYHRRVQRSLTPLLGTAERTWLRAACAALKQEV